jgi:hypothetical protein
MKVLWQKAVVFETTGDTFDIISVTLAILQIQIWKIPNKKEEC